MRLFIAVDVPPWIIRPLYATQKELPAEKLRIVKPDNMHFTLKFLGDVNPKKVQRITDALSRIEHKKFEAVVKGAGAFPNEEYVRTIWVGCRTKGLSELAAKVEAALPDFPKEPFVGHMTIARVTRRLDLRSFFQKYREWRFGDFIVEKFYLVQSELSSGGPKYEVLAGYPLSD